MLEMKIGHLIREGKVVACSPSQKMKLRIRPEYLNLIVTKPKDIPKGKEVVFVGEMNDEERRIWKSYLEANPTIWTTS